MRTSHLHPAHRARCWYRILMVVLFGMTLVSPTGPVAARPPNSLTAETFTVETFVGPDFVDFWWDPAEIPGCATFSIWRKTSTTSYELVAEPACGAGLYTDNSAMADTAYQYQLAVQNDAEPPVTLYTAFKSATPGQIGGHLHRSLSLGGSLTIGGISVGEGAQLSLNSVTASGGTISDAIVNGDMTVREQGIVTVNGGAFDGTTFSLRNAASSVAGLALANGSISTPGSVQGATLMASALGFYGTGSVSLSDSAMTDSNVSFAEGVGADIGGNEFVASILQIRGTTTAEVYGNDFVDSALRIWEQAAVLAGTNTFAGTIPDALAFVDVTSDAGVTLEGNTMNVSGTAGTKPAVLIQPDTAPGDDAVYALVSNVLRGDNAATTGVKVVADSAGISLDVALTDNTIGSFDRGVELHDNLGAGGVIVATLSGNTITSNAEGILPRFGGVESSLTAHNNCIAGNVTGVRCLNTDFVIDATSNYWGHPTGPTHFTNPDGLGDRLTCSDAATEIDFDPWLESHTCYISGLNIANIEVIQTLQTVSNTIPLVAEKATLVRVFPDMGIGFAAVDGTLTGSRGGVTLGTLPARAPIQAGMITDWDAVRADLDASLMFDLPEDWLRGGVTLRAEVTSGAPGALCAATEAMVDGTPFAVVGAPVGAQHAAPLPTPLPTPRQTSVVDTVETAVMTTTATFHERRPVAITYIPASVDVYSERHEVTPKDILEVHERILARFPFGEVTVRILPDAERYVGNLDGVAWGMHWAYLSGVVRRWEILNNPEGAADYYLTVYGTSGNDFTGSWWHFGEPNGRGACGLRMDGQDCAVTMGNLLGLRPLSIEPEQADPPFDYVFPYGDRLTHELGYDTVSGKLQSPALYDLMAWAAMFDGAPAWISDFHYEKTYLNLAPSAPAASVVGAQHAAPLQTPLQAASEADVGDYLYITGLAGPDDAVFNPVLHLADSPTPDDVTPVDSLGAYCLQARNWAGTVLEERCFDLDLTSIDGGDDYSMTAFTAELADNPEIRQLQLRYNSSTIKQLVVPSSPPEITLVSASYDETYKTAQIAWTTPPEAHPKQRYHVHYSPDNGATWIPVGIDIVPDKVTYVDGAFRWGVRAEQIPAGAQARLRLIASDGFNETIVTSAPFTVPDVGPWLDILAPENNAVIEDLPVNFEGYAYDVENGDRSEAITWTSDKDGPLGTGAIVSVDTLSPGVHIVTLSADDGEGHVGTKIVRLTVGTAGDDTIENGVFLPLVVR